jgi:hypothetical protein
MTKVTGLLGNLSLKTMVNFSLALGLKLTLDLEDLESPVVES